MYKMQGIFTALLLLSSVFAGSPTVAEDLPRRAYLGAAIRPPIGDQAGATIMAVREGTAAEKAGLERGDRILRIDGELLSSPWRYFELYQALDGDQTVRFDVLRDGKVREIVIDLPTLPEEQIEGLDVAYDSVLSDRGHRVRTIVTRPEGAQGPLPGIFLVGWLSCDTVEYPLGVRPNDGFARLLHALAKESGFAMMRMDKPGVGDSEGPPCAELDFQTELAAYQAAFRAFRALDFVDPEKIFLLGMSNGSGVAPLVPGDLPAAGYVVTGGWVKTWYEHMMEHERRRLALVGKTPAEVNEGLRDYAELYTGFLSEKLTPGEVLRRKPHLRDAWYEGPEHMYGRSAAFFHQLQELNLEEAWSQVDVPTLAIHGEYDWIMSEEDHQIIADLVDRSRPGAGRFESIPGMDHNYLVYDSAQKAFDGEGGEFAESIVPLILNWLQEHR